ncbi:uncharacterized protein isoform X1 [Leptinotarsa decemlineata]|uniref:uncharacterized protein isoform X1 n=1 Tax=Leptinotarsa decemlineata TaxID=7539 RepID=UPI003D306357
MSGVVFTVSIPTEAHEKYLRKDIKKKVTVIDFPELIHVEQCGSEKGKSIKKPLFPSDETKRKGSQSMQMALQTILIEMNITNSTWCGREQDNYQLVIFPIDSSDRCDEILEVLKENGIGQRFNSVVSVIPCSIQYHANQDFEFKQDEDIDIDNSERTTGWHRFITSIRARLTVAQVVENVKMHASLTFDFIFLILISTTMCAIGLVENSNVYLLSSMVICPMMGPVMAGTFGSVIQHRGLLKIGVRNEIIGMGIATLVGFCYGSVICAFTDIYGTQTWPTYEMLSRGELRYLWVGCLIALLSGAVVALGVLSDNIASLVGVAISTSITPPAVNAGLLWSLASIYFLKGDLTTRLEQLTLHNYYFDDPISELIALGAVSICITFTNIICIYAAGIIVFKIKEVAPIHPKDNARKRFWKHDIKIARDYNKTIQKGMSGECMIKKLSEELAHYRKYGYHEPLNHSTDLTTECLKNNPIRSQYTWSPCMDLDSGALKNLCQKLMKEHGSSMVQSSRNTEDSSHHRRLSQIFPPEIKKQHEQSSKQDLNLSMESGHSSTSTSRQYSLGNKKFIVTPCKSDGFLP